MRCYVFDIDGTIADCSHRLHHIENEPKDWDAFYAACYKDKPISPLTELAWELEYAGFGVLFLTGRSEQCRQATKDWLSGQGFHEPPLYMRRAGDHRPDTEVKSELMDRAIVDGFEPIMVFEDRASVVKMWRARGIPCAQVAEGNF